MRVERVERFLSFPLTSGRKEKKKSEFCRRYSWGHSIPELFFLTILELAFVWPHAGVL